MWIWKIMNARISNIEQGRKGNPGEIKGMFWNRKCSRGNRQKLTYGIYGIIGRVFKNNKVKAIPIGFKEEVKEGDAYILATIEDDKVEKFDIEILKAQFQQYPGQKSMTIKIKDKRLLQ